MEEYQKRSFDVLGYTSQGFRIFQKEPWLLIGFFIVSMVAILVLNFIPIIGQFFGSFLSIILFAGFYILAHKISQNQAVEFSNGFDGFNKVVPLVLYTLLIGGFFVLLMFALGGSTLISLAGMDPQTMDPDEMVEIFSGLSGKIFWIFILGMVINIGLFYAICNILFKDADVISAIKDSFILAFKNPLHIFLFFLLWGLIVFISVLFLGLGLLVTIPSFYAAVYSAWKDQSAYDDTEAFDIKDNLV
jgi:hypothetical protein